MNLQEVYIVQPTTEQAVNIKAILKALKVKFDVAKVESPYNEAFVAKIKKSKLQYKQGKYTTVTKKNINNFLAAL
jgi:hypothetical protein